MSTESAKAIYSGAPMASAVSYVEHHISHDGHLIYTRDYPGQGPAYVMLHGFPDNLHIYDYVVPYLTAAGRRVVVFDFLGFGQSDKTAPGYNFEPQVGDLSVIVDALKIDKFVARRALRERGWARGLRIRPTLLIVRPIR